MSGSESKIWRKDEVSFWFLCLEKWGWSVSQDVRETSLSVSLFQLPLVLNLEEGHSDYGDLCRMLRSFLVVGGFCLLLSFVFLHEDGNGNLAGVLTKAASSTLRCELEMSPNSFLKYFSDPSCQAVCWLIWSVMVSPALQEVTSQTWQVTEGISKREVSWSALGVCSREALFGEETQRGTTGRKSELATWPRKGGQKVLPAERGVWMTAGGLRVRCRGACCWGWWVCGAQLTEGSGNGKIQALEFDVENVWKEREMGGNPQVLLRTKYRKRSTQRWYRKSQRKEFWRKGRVHTVKGRKTQEGKDWGVRVLGDIGEFAWAKPGCRGQWGQRREDRDGCSGSLSTVGPRIPGRQSLGGMRAGGDVGAQESRQGGEHRGQNLPALLASLPGLPRGPSFTLGITTLVPL